MIDSIRQAYNRLSIRGKLLSVIVGTALIALFLGFGLVLWFNLTAMRNDMESSVRHVTAVAAEFAEAPLSFNDAKGAGEVLSRLQTVSDVIIAAYLIDADGEIFSRYETHTMRTAAVTVDGLLAVDDGVIGSFMVSSAPVAVSGTTVGRVVIIATLDPLYSRMYGFVLSTSGIFLIVTLVALLCAIKLEHHISDRIIALTDVLGLITTDQSKSTRARDIDGMEDEISHLYDTVNQLLAEIEHREAERDRVEELLRENENRFKAIIQDQTELIFRTDECGFVTFVNEACCRFFGKLESELIASSFYDLLPTELHEAVRRNFEAITLDDPVRTHQYEIILYNGESAWLEWINRAIPNGSGEIVGYQGVGRDITELKKTQEEKEQIQRQLYHSQRLETIGTLAGGIAHDFNNILTPLRGYVDLLQLDIAEESVSGQRLAQIHMALERARQLVAGILTFSGHNEITRDRSSVDIANLVESVISFMRATIPRTIVISVEKASEEPYLVEADESKIHQALMNLCTNAFQAMEHSGGELRIVVGKKTIQQSDILPGEGLFPGVCISISVIDTGCGIKSDVLERIYDPFFTTKEVGKGTGLGLSVVRGIIVDHDGAIRVSSKQGAGTEFEVLLPVATTIASSAYAAQEAKSRILGSPLVFVLDDEKAIVTIADELLTSLGCRVLTAQDPVLALVMIAELSTLPDLIISDFTMPGMTGEEFIARLRDQGVQASVVLATGYSNVALDPGRLSELGIVKVLQKPYNLQLLRTTLVKLFPSARDVSAA